MKMLQDYFKLQKEIYKYFGYVEDWVVIPLDDNTEHEWMLIENFRGGGYVVYSSKLTENDITAGNCYGGPVYTQRFLPKWVYRADDYTMICLDTQTDGNKFLSVFDNKKEITDDKLKTLYGECWGTIC